MVIDTSVVTGQFIGGTGTPGTTNMAKASGIAITRGDICNIATGTTPDSLQTCPASGHRPVVLVRTNSAYRNNRSQREI